MEQIGFTTTIPVEILLAAGVAPVDLNNRFITDGSRDTLTARAERHGYPRNVCSWIKGMYGVLTGDNTISRIVAVTQGDCSNTHALMETLALQGIKSIPFAYPYNRDKMLLRAEMEELASTFSTTLDAAEHIRERLEPLRTALDRLDKMTWCDGRVTGAENHDWLVSSSDFNGDPSSFADRLNTFLSGAVKRKAAGEGLRVGVIGVPPIYDDLHDVLEQFGGRVVYNEVQRQFSMPERTGDIVDQYHAYTYPYGMYARLEAILREVERRRIDGLIHYVQSFCHRHIEDVVVRAKAPVPVLTVEGESPGPVDERTKIRLQAFVEMLTG